MATITLTSAATAAAQFLGVLDSGESLSTTQISDALAAANNLIANWSDEQIMIPVATKLTQVLTQGLQSYALGGTPPLAIAAAAFTNLSGPGGNVDVLSAPKWAALPDRQAESFIIRYLFYDRAGNIFVSPVPLGSTLSLELWTWTTLAFFADATTPLTLPNAGYARLFTLALAIELAPQYDTEPSPQLMANYADAMARVRKLNAELLGTEPPAGDVTAASGAPVPANQAAQ